MVVVGFPSCGGSDGALPAIRLGGEDDQGRDDDCGRGKGEVD